MRGGSAVLLGGLRGVGLLEVDLGTGAGDEASDESELGELLEVGHDVSLSEWIGRKNRRGNCPTKAIR